MENEMRPAPYRIETARLVLRCPDPSDAAAIHDGVLESLDALRPWMPWVEADPISLAQRTSEIRRLRGGFERGEDFTFMVFAADGGAFVGGMGLHPRVGPRGLELGYWVRTSQQGRELAGEGVRALIHAAFRHMNADRVEIRIEPRNAASRRVVEKLGVTREATLLRRLPRGGKLRDVDVFTVFAGEVPAAVNDGSPVRCFDRSGRPLDVEPSGQGR